MTKTQKFKKIYDLAKEHGEIVVYFHDTTDQFRRRKIRSSGHCFVSHLCWDPSEDPERWKHGEYTKYGMSCFVMDDGGPKSLLRTMRLMKAHDRGYLNPIVIEIRKRRIEL